MDRHLQFYTRTRKIRDDFGMEASSITPNVSAESLSNLTTKGSFRNLELISKLSLVARFDQELVGILRVKEKVSISKLSHFFWAQVYE